MTAALTLTYGALNLTASPFLVPYGSDTGSPENEVISLTSFIQDGDIELSSRAGNRTIQFDVLIEGASLTALATAEANLVAETEKALNTLTVDWGDGSPAAVYDVFRGQVALVRDDSWEIARMRRYAVTVRALPFPRSLTETVTTALPATGTTTTSLDACSATTGWVGTINGGAATVSTAGGAISITQASPTAGAYVFTLTKTFAATTTSTKLLVVDWKPSIGGGALTATGDGTALRLMAEGASPTAGYVRSWFYVSASSLAVTRFTWTYTPTDIYPLVPSLVLSLDQVSVSDAPPVYGTTGRQQLRTVALSGSARTSGSIALEGSTSLGQTFIYTYPANASTNGYTPSLRQFRTAGASPTSDSAMVSGFRDDISGSGTTMQVPLTLLPKGLYLLIVRLGVTGIAPISAITYTQSTVLGSNTLGSVAVTTPTFTPTTTYTPYIMGRISLPTVDVDQFTPAKLQMNLKCTAGTVYFDEAWLFNTSIGALTWVDCGSGTAAVGGPAKRLFLESPSVGTPRPTLRVGHSADRSDAYYPIGSVHSWQSAQLVPPLLNIMAVTDNATDAVLSARYKAAWHTNPSS